MTIFDIQPISVSDLILFGTGIVVLIYTRATQKSNELQERPIIQFEYRETDSGLNGSSRMGSFFVKNIWKGPAYNIQLEKFELSEKGRGVFTYQPYLENPFLEAGQEVRVKFWIRTPNGGVEGSDERRLLFRMTPDTLNPTTHKEIRYKTPVIFVANYTGINGQDYHSIFHFYCSLLSVGEMFMQFIKFGKGKTNFEEAKCLCLTTGILKHPGEKASEKKIKQE